MPLQCWNKKKKKGNVSFLGNKCPVQNFNSHSPLLNRDSKLTMLLRESLGNINCRTTMIAHISDSPANYPESLAIVQLASRIHRMRKKKSKVSLFFLCTACGWGWEACLLSCRTVLIIEKFVFALSSVMSQCSTPKKILRIQYISVVQKWAYLIWQY